MADLVRVSPDARHVWQGETELALRPMQRRLLHLLVSHAGSVVSLPEIAAGVWGCDARGIRKTVDMTMTGLRRALGDDAGNPTYITNVRGVGWRFAADLAVPLETRTVDIAGARYDVVRWEKGPAEGPEVTFTLYAQEVSGA